MELIIHLIKQISIMFIYMAVGYIMYRKKMITKEGSKELGTFLLYVITSCMIIKAYMTKYTEEKMIGLVISFFLSTVGLLISILVARLCFGSKYKIEHFGTSFSNAGFIGASLVQATLGDEAMFYASAFVALLNILQWTYGVMVMTDSKNAIKLEIVCRNPILISLLIGLLIYIINIPVPSVISTPIDVIGGMTAPVAMIILGVYLAQTELIDLFTDKRAYLSSFLRLLTIPLLTILAFYLVPNQYMTVKMAVLVAACTPVGANVAIFAQLNHLDYTQAVKSVCLSTIFSIITIPLIIGIAETVW